MSEQSPLPSPQHEALASAFDDDRYDSVVELAETQISLWVSIREGAYRRERLTLVAHCEQTKILTKAVFATVRALGAKPDEATEG